MSGTIVGPLSAIHDGAILASRHDRLNSRRGSYRRRPTVRTTIIGERLMITVTQKSGRWTAERIERDVKGD